MALRIYTGIISLLLLVVTLVGCAPATGNNNETMIPPALLGGWNARELESAAVIPPSVPNIIFSDDGTVTGNGSCNGFNGTFQTDGNQLTIREVGSTRMACGESGVMEQETRFFAALERTTTYTINGDTLTLSDAEGNVLVTLVTTAG